MNRSAICAWAVTLFLCLPSVTVFAQPPGEGQEESTEAGKKTPPPEPPKPKRRDPMGLAPTVSGAELRAQAQAAYTNGMKFVLSSQNEDGTWGSAMPKMPNLKNFGFGTTNKGSNDGVLHACTAIIAKALLRKKSRTPAEQASLDKAVGALLSTKKFAYSGGEAFNTWGYGYKLSFLVDYLLSPEGAGRRTEIAAAAKVCIDGLRRYQLVDGGWNYYATPSMGGTSMSFNTANFARALHRADRAGLEVPKGMVGDAVKVIKRMVTATGKVVYDARFINSPRSVNELSTAARTAAVTEALVEIGEYGQREMDRALEIFLEGENWLEHGRKLIQPHTAVHQVSGYFFFYGYFYLAEFMLRIDDDALLARWQRNAWAMIRTQDKDGSWWDTPAAGYGDMWGTGFAMLVLQAYFDAVPPEADVDPEEEKLPDTSGTTDGG